MSLAARREAAKAAAEEKARQAEAHAAEISREHTDLILRLLDELCGDDQLSDSL